MSKWSHPEEWERLLKAETCPVCLAGGPRDMMQS